MFFFMASMNSTRKFWDCSQLMINYVKVENFYSKGLETLFKACNQQMEHYSPQNSINNVWNEIHFYNNHSYVIGFIVAIIDFCISSKCSFLYKAGKQLYIVIVRCTPKYTAEKLNVMVICDYLYSVRKLSNCKMLKLF